MSTLNTSCQLSEKYNVLNTTSGEIPRMSIDTPAMTYRDTSGKSPPSSAPDSKRVLSRLLKSAAPINRCAGVFIEECYQATIFDIGVLFGTDFCLVISALKGGNVYVGCV